MVLLLANVAAFADTSPVLKPAEGKERSAEVQLFQESRMALSEERQLLEAQAERHFSRLDNIVNRIIWGVTILSVIAIGILAWSFGSTRKDLKESIRKLFENHTRELVEREAEQVRKLYHDLKIQVDELSAHKKRRVTWVLPETSNGQSELEALYSTGLKNIELITPKIDESFYLGNPDLVIFSYSGDSEGKRQLQIIVDELKTETPPVSLLIYTYNPTGQEVRLGDAERKILKGFHWYIPVNFPSTLVLQTQLLIRKAKSPLGGGNNG